jgi:carbamoylphosphate synthase small subunit
LRNPWPKINIIGNEKGEITTNTKEIQGIIRDYFENLYSNNLENVEEIDKFLVTYDFPKLNQEDVNHLSRSITWNEIEAVMVSKKKKSPRRDGFSVEFHQIFKEELITIIPKLFHKIEREG